MNKVHVGGRAGGARPAERKRAPRKTCGKTTCPVCHRRFTRRTKHHVYCSSACRMKAFFRRMVQAEVESINLK